MCVCFCLCVRESDSHTKQCWLSDQSESVVTPHTLAYCLLPTAYIPATAYILATGYWLLATGVVEGC